MDLFVHDGLLWKHRAQIKNLIPTRILNSILLGFPKIYQHKLINFETNMCPTTFEKFLFELNSTLGVAGNIVECGTARGGSCAIMANYLKKIKSNKLIYAFDSFSGFHPDEARQEENQLTRRPLVFAFKKTGLGYFQKKMEVLGHKDRVFPIKGYFQDTLNIYLPESICFAFVDCDLSNSLDYCLEQIWPKLSVGGKILIDDYLSPFYPGVKKIVDNFILNKRSTLTSKIIHSFNCLEKLA